MVNYKQVKPVECWCMVAVCRVCPGRCLLTNVHQTLNGSYGRQRRLWEGASPQRSLRGLPTRALPWGVVRVWRRLNRQIQLLPPRYSQMMEHVITTTITALLYRSSYSYHSSQTAICADKRITRLNVGEFGNLADGVVEISITAYYYWVLPL